VPEQFLPIRPALDGCVSIFTEIIAMPAQYIPIFIFALLAAAFPAVTLVIFRLIRPTPPVVGAKLKPYECGVEAEGDTRGRYSVRFYIVAILFVIFDVETVFLFPWAVLFSTRNAAFRLPDIYALASMFVFLVILIVGYVWLYMKGALEWV
jgi:NADH-quinone oxidoreductase subunit A